MKNLIKKWKDKKIGFVVSIFLTFLIVISLGSALLSSTLNIGGNAKIKENSWVIYFDEIRDISASNPYEVKPTIVDLKKTRIDFDATLDQPGDYLEFYVDTVNDGTIDAAIDSIDLPDLTDEQKKYIEFRVIDTSTGLDLKRCDTLLVGERKEVKVLLEFKEGLELSEYPPEPQTLNLSFAINYVQHPIDGCDTVTPKKYKLYIIPNGGVYEKRTTPSRVALEENDEYTTKIPTRKLYNFDGWEVVTPNGEGDYDVVELTGNEDFEFNPINDIVRGNWLFKMGKHDTYIRAKWVENDYVARIEDTYYTTIQAAFDSVDGNNPKTGRKWTDNTVWLLRDTTEYPTNNAHDAFTFNLDGHTVTGSITNPVTGTITMVNGRVQTKSIENFKSKINDKTYSFTEDEQKDLYAFKNYGTVNIGIDEGLVEVDNSIALSGNQAGLFNYENFDDDSKSATFNFYDGYLEGLTGYVGEYDDTPENYYVFSEYITDTDKTKSYLIRNPSRAVAKTYAGNTEYHYNLQSAINKLASHQRDYGTAREKDYKIDAIRNFEAAYELSIGGSSKIVFDLVGYTVHTGENITNEGEFTITNSNNNPSSLIPSKTIENKNKLIINNVDLTSSTDKDVIVNSGQLDLSKTTITGNDAYGVKNIGQGTINFDNDTILKSEDKCGLYNTGNRLVINSGKIYCFLNEGTATSTGNPEYYLFKTRTQPNSNSIRYMAAIRNSGTLNFNDGSVTTSTDTNMIENSGTFNFNDGLIRSEYLAVSNSGTFNANGSELSSVRTPISGGRVNVNGGDIKSETTYAINGSNVVVNEGNVYTEDGIAITGATTTTVNGGTVRGTTYAIRYRNNNYSATVNVTGGLVEAPVAIDVAHTNISGGIVKGVDNGVITSNYTMTGGKVISTEGIGVTISNVGDITGGEVYGSTYGVLSQNELTLGRDDGEISSTSPMLLGELYGLYITGPTTNFYDGILKGETDGYYGPITGTPLGGVVFEGDEYILKDENGEYVHSSEGTEGAEFYNTDFIASIDPWLRIGNTTYNTLNAASLAIEDGGEATIYVTRDVDILFAQKIFDDNKNKNITLDLNGYKVSTTQKITSYTDLTITDTSKDENKQEDAGNSDGELKFIKNVGFTNENKLTIDGGHFVSTVSGLFINNKDMIINNGIFNVSNTVVDNNSKLTINGGRIESSVNAIDSSDSTVIMNDGYIYASNTAIVNGAFTMNGGEIYAVNNGTTGGYDSGSVVLNDGKITAENGHAAQRNWYNSIKINGGEYTSLHNIAIKCHYYIYIYGGTITGTIGVEDGGFSNGINEWIYGDTYVNGSNVKIYGTESYGVNVLYGTLYDSVGYISGETDGIYTNSAIIQLGYNDGTISKEQPVVVGKRYGVNNYQGTFRFYDGIIKGKASTSDANDGHHGIVTLIPDGTMVKDDDFEFIDRVEYDVEYLETIGDWIKLSSNGQTYNSINAAYQAAQPTDTMTVTRNVHVAFEQSMPSGKNITFNTDGKSVTFTQTLKLSCTTKFIDSEGTGSLHNIRTGLISNSGNMTVESGTYTTEKGNAIASGGTLNINGGYFTSDETYPISNSGTLNFEDGEIKTTKTYAVKNTGLFNMNHGEIKTYEGVLNSGTLNVKNDSRIEGTNGLSVSANGTVNIEDDAVIYNEYTNAMSSSCGQINVNGGTITSTVTNAISLGYSYGCGYGKLKVNNGTITGKTNGVVAGESGNITNIYGGYIKGIEGNGLNTKGNTNIIGGVIEGGVYGVYVYGGTTNIGEDNGSISIAEPVLKGELYGLYISNPQQMTVNFYDGILKGQTWGHYNDVTNIPDRSNIIYGYETIDNKLYNTAYLYQEGDIAKNTRTLKIYNNLQDALDEAEENDTVELINDVPLFYQVINTRNLTLDMKGHTISTNKNITNRGNLKIVNTADKEAVIQTSINTYLITNTNKIEFDNVTLRNVSASYYVVNSTGETKLNNTKIDSVYGISSSDKLTITNSNIKATQTAINNTGELSVSGGKYVGSSYSLYSNSRRPVNITGVYTLDNNNGLIYSSDTEFNGTFYNTGGNTTTIDGIVVVGNLQNSTSLNMSNTKVTGSYTNSSSTTVNRCVLQRGHSNSGTETIDESIIFGNGGDKLTNSGNITINDTNIELVSSQSECSYYTCYPYNAVTNSGTMTINRSEIGVDRTTSLRYETRGIYNNGTLYFQDNSVLNVGQQTRAGGTFIGIYSEGSSRATINSTINIDGGSTGYGVYINNTNAQVTLETGTINVNYAPTTYGTFINLGTFTMGHEEKQNEQTVVSTEDPRINSNSPSKGIGVKKINGSFNFYDGLIWASKFTKPETTTNVQLNYEVTTYVDEVTGFEYALLEYMQNDYQGTTVAKIGETHYRTVQDAINKVEPGEEILIVRSTSEELVVPADRIVKINLNNHSITTHLENNGSLQVYNGSLQNFDLPAVENNGTLIMGTLDDPVSSTSIRIVSEGTPVINNGTFKMYDGYLEGNPSLEGSVNEIAEYARLYTTRDSQSEKKYLQSLSRESIIAGETDLILTIDPYGGYYENSKEIKTTYLKYQEEFDLSIPTKRACDFIGWESSDTEALNNEGNKITMGVTDVTVTAKWEVSDRAVAKVGNEYFESLQEALDNAGDNPLVELLKDTTENINNRSNVTLDLGGHKVTGAFVNNGILKILNGEIENPDGIGLVNNKSLTLGENDGEINEDIVRILGTEIGLEQNGRFNFYDGFIEGDIALIGKTDSVPKGYFLYNERDTVRNQQKIYLIGNPANAVAVIEDGGTQYFFSLQDAINTANVTGSEIFIVRDFEASYPVEVPEGANILINMNSYNITTGNNITNNGTLRIYDTSETFGSITSARTITNNGTLTIEGINIKQNTANDTINSTSNATLTINNCTIEAKDGHAIYSEGELNLLNNYILKSNIYSLYNKGNELTINGGTIYGIETTKNIIVEDGANIIGNGSNGRAGIAVRDSADIIVNGGTISSTGNNAIYNNGSNVNVTVNGGTITGTTGLYCDAGTSNYVVNGGTITTTGIGIRMQASNCNLEVNDVTLTASSQAIYFYNERHVIKIKGGDIKSTGSYGLHYDYSSSNMSTIEMTGGKITGTSYGMYLYGAKLNMTGGEITHTDTSNYALYVGSYSGATIGGDAFINSPSASGIWETNNVVIKDNARVYAGAYNAYGIHTNGANVYLRDNAKIETPGTSAIGVHLNDNSNNPTVYIEGGEIISGSIGIHAATGNSSRAINLYGGTVKGNSYGIYQSNSYSTINIGNINEDLSTQIPYISGGLYGVYNGSGTVNFYNGRARGYTNGYYGVVTNIRSGYEITSLAETSDQIEYLTYSTTNVSNEAISNAAKQGNGYAKITYIDESNDICTNGQEFIFDYIGDEDTFTPRCAGKYKLEVWGAQGGGTTSGYGGYSSGEINLSDGEVLYINVGGQGNTTISYNGALGGYNGGGRGGEGTGGYIGGQGGGGATHIATRSGLLSTLENNKSSVLIVAGGGGGVVASSWNSLQGGHGGGYLGNGGQPYSSSYTAGTGGSQTSGYAFGQGAPGANGYNTNCSAEGNGGSGGGWYGGTARLTKNGTYQNVAGSGGSGYIANTRISNGVMYGYNVTTTHNEWINNFLIEKEAFVQVGDRTFNSLNAAQAYIEENGEGTMTLLKDAEITELTTLEANKTITFDLNGYTLNLTRAIDNSSDLTIIDSSQEKTGKLIFTNTDAINSKNGNLTIDGVYIKTNKNLINTSNSATPVIKIMNNSKLEGNYIINYGTAQKTEIYDSILTASDRIISSSIVGTNVTIENSTLTAGGHAVLMTGYRGVFNIKDTDIYSTTGYALYMEYGTSTDSDKNVINVTGGSLTSRDTHSVYLYGSKLKTIGTEIKTNANSYDRYAIYASNYSVTNLTEGTKVEAPNASGIYITSQDSSTTIDNTTLEVGTSTGYAIYQRGSTLNIKNNSKIISNGLYAHAIYLNNSTMTVNITDSDVISNHTAIGIYDSSSGHTRNVNINSGKIRGRVYGIYQNYSGSTVTIGNVSNEFTIETPIIQGGDYGYYKNSGTSKFYNGKIMGLGRTYNTDFNVLRTRKTVYSTEEYVEEEGSTDITISTPYISEEPISKYTKKGNGYAKITYLDETNNDCTQNQEYVFDYTGSEQTFTPTCDGTYLLEVWGAQGGNTTYNSYSNRGGFGGYSKGKINLTTSDTLHIYVGGKGQSIDYKPSSSVLEKDDGTGYNGGGYASYASGNSSHAGGGGATHIATTSGLLSSLENNKDSILIVAGGGGGASTHKSYGSYSGTGGSGGGTTGGMGLTTNSTCYNYGTGGSQTEPGSFVACPSDGRTTRTGTVPTNPTFGSGSNYTSFNTSATYSGGGGGYYGGQSGFHAPGGGGSGYISSSLYSAEMYIYGLYTERGEWKVSYLTEREGFLEVNGTVYNNFEDAAAAIDTEGTIKVLNDTLYNETGTLPVDKTITLDLNGKKLQMSENLINNSNLTIIDSSQNKTGMIENIYKDTIVNKGTLTVEGTYIKSVWAPIVGNSGTGEIIVNESTIDGPNGIWLTTNQKLTVTSSHIINASNYGIYSNIQYHNITVKDSEISGSGTGIYINQADATLLVENTTINTTSSCINTSNYRENITIKDSDLYSISSYAIYTGLGTNDDSSKIRLNVYDSTLKSRDSHGIHLYGVIANIYGSTVSTLINNRDYYAIYIGNYTTLKLYDNTKLIADKASGIYMTGDYNYVTINDATIEANNYSSYGVNVRGYGNVLTINDGAFIKTTGGGSIGVYQERNTTTINLNGGEIDSGCVGAHMGSNTSSSYNRTLNINNGKIYGSVYGVESQSPYNTINVGNRDYVISKYNPEVEGGTYGIYEETGTLNFYSGRVSGSTGAYVGIFNTIRNGFEIYEETSDISNELQAYRTYTTTEHSTEATANTPKENNGYAKITYNDTKEIKSNYSDVDTINCADLIGAQYVYKYTGSEQEFKPVCNGTYKIELWGAAGGSVKNDRIKGGNGAYTSGNIELTKNDKLYVYVGEYYNGYRNTMSYNGGGSGTYSSYSGDQNGNGGGATDVRLVNGAWDNFDSLKSRIMVAAGGGGASNYGNGSTGGVGGTLIGGSGNHYAYSGGAAITVASGGTQTSGGLYATANPQPSDSTLNGKFGIGGHNTTYSANYIYNSGGGGGYYGGGSGGAVSSNVGSAAGGSSFISGYVGCDAIAEESTSDNIIHTGEPVHYSNKVFNLGIMIDGNSNMPTKDGLSTMVGNNGAGYAKITLLELDEDIEVEFITEYGTLTTNKKNYRIGDRIGTLETPTVEENNILFDGWYTEPSYKNRVDENYELQGSMQLYAKFKKKNNDCSLVDGTSYTFDYTGSEELFTPTCDGKYTLEVWGAQGGGPYGGYGGYSKGDIYLHTTDNLYINVGGKGEQYDGGYNGGGNGINSSGTWGYGGGGATHIAFKSGLLSTLSNAKDKIIIVAGGGGGGSGSSTGGTGGSGGGFHGGTGYDAGNSSYTRHNGTGGTQANPGYNYNYSSYGVASFGKGANAYNYGAGGGAGYYGGGGSRYGYTGAGGGSGYTGNSLLENKYMYGYNISTRSTSDIAKTIYLVIEQTIVYNETQDTYYSNLQTAITESNTNDVIKLIKSTDISYTITVPDTKNLTLDLNGYNIVTSKLITNNGTLRITNSKENTTSKISSKLSINLLNNNSNLSIDNMEINCYNAISNNSNGVLTVNGSTISSSNQAINNTGEYSISNSSITGTNYAIYDNGNKTNTITDSILNSSNGIYKNTTNTTTITNTPITGNVTNNTSGILNITGESINGYVTNKGTYNMTGVTMNKTVSTSDSIQLINNSGTMTLENNNLTILNTYNYNNNSLTIKDVYNSGTLTSRGNTYTSKYINSYDSNRKYQNIRPIENAGLLTSNNDNFEGLGGYYCYAIYNNSTSDSKVYNMTANIHDCYDARFGYNNSEKANTQITFDGVNGEIHHSTIGQAFYVPIGSMNIKNVNVNVHDNTTSKAAYVTGGTLTIESGTYNVSGDTAYGVQMTSGTLTLGIYDGRGTDAADVSITNPHIVAVGSTSGIGVSMGNGTFNYYDGYISGSTHARAEGDITSSVDKNYQVVTRIDEETGYEYCILEFIH